MKQYEYKYTQVCTMKMCLLLPFAVCRLPLAVRRSFWAPSQSAVLSFAREIKCRGPQGHKPVGTQRTLSKNSLEFPNLHSTTRLSLLSCKGVILLINNTRKETHIHPAPSTSIVERGFRYVSLRTSQLAV